MATTLTQIHPEMGGGGANRFHRPNSQYNFQCDSQLTYPLNIALAILGQCKKVYRKMAPRLFGFLCLVVHGALALQLPGF
jgi:hypothetical protein